MTKASKPAPDIAYYDNGGVRYRGFQLDGEPHGAWEFLRKDGSVMRAGAFDRGKQIGIWRTLDRHGRVVKETDFSMTSSRTSAKTANAKSAKLLVAMTGKASPAKAAEGDGAVFAYIASLPQPQRGIAERIDALAAEQVSDLRRAVKWGMAYYGVGGGGWCFSSGAFVGHLKLMFIRGTELEPEPPVTPVGMGKATRGVELASVDDLDARLAASWMKQAAAMPFFGGKKR